MATTSLSPGPDAPPLTWGEKLGAFLDERGMSAELREVLRHKQVPVHRHTLWYYTGGFTLFLFLVQVVTGILLLLYYRPTSNEAFESLQFIVTRVEFGWLVRSVHSWSANLMVFSLHVHLLAVVFLRAYRRPRELTWLTGMALFFIVLAFGFSGYLLPWNQLAFFATSVGTEIPGAVPVVGPFLVRLLRGGSDVTGATLTRFFGLHVAILPLLTTIFLGLHLALVQKHGMSVPLSVEAADRAGRPPRFIPFVPNFALRELIGWLVAVAILAALAAFLPWELGVKADPFAPAPAGIRPEWYFVWMFQTLKVLPAHVLGIEGELFGVLAFGVLGALVVFLPFIDRRPGQGRIGKLVPWAALAGLLYLVAMTAWCYLDGGQP